MTLDHSFLQAHVDGKSDAFVHVFRGQLFHAVADSSRCATAFSMEVVSKQTAGVA